MGQCTLAVDSCALNCLIDIASCNLSKQEHPLAEAKPGWQLGPLTALESDLHPCLQGGQGCGYVKAVTWAFQPGWLSPCPLTMLAVAAAEKGERSPAGGGNTPEVCNAAFPRNCSANLGHSKDPRHTFVHLDLLGLNGHTCNKLAQQDPVSFC